jgi:ABC-type glycerol-3-phosphate transport system substrate-binding protein
MFDEDSGGIEVEVVVYPYADYLTALKTALPGGTGPDVFEVNWQVVQPYVSADLLRPLDDLASATWGEWKDAFLKPVIDEIMRLGKEDGSGNAYMLATNCDVAGYMWYNIPVFEEHGISVPKDWAEFESICEELKSVEVLPIVMGGKDQWQHQWWWLALAEVLAPGKMAKVEEFEISFVDDDLERTAVTYKSMFDNHWFAEGTMGMDVWTGAMPLFWQSEAAMFMAGSWAIYWTGSFVSEEVNKATEHMGCFLPPGGKGLSTVSTAWSMTQTAKEPEAAWEFIKFWVDGRGAEVVATFTGLPASKRLPPKSTGTPFDKNIIEPSIKQMFEGENAFANPRCATLAEAIGNSCQGLALGQLTPEQMLVDLQSVNDSQCKR